jgi:chloramphenicol-sensitive protein RarD
MRDERLIGGAYAAAAFGAWGVLPVYFHVLSHVPAPELLSHRIVWSVLLLAGLVTALGRWPAIRAAVRDPRTRLMLLGSTLFICANWLTFIWAVAAERVMEISLGYYINPLVNVLLGVLVLRERLSPAQGVAVALAALGVANLAWQTTGLPWPSLVVALSFGFYGLIRKTTPLASIEGLFLETSIMGPFALAFLLWLGASGQGAFTGGGLGQALLLMAAGLVTSLPLIWFASGARRISYIAVGFFQYLAPTGHFLLAVFAFGEPFSLDHAITFAFIWTALAVFSLDRWRQATQDRRARRAAAAE